MELRGTNAQGDDVSASIKDLAEINRKDGERVDYGSTPQNVVYTHIGTGKQREVDLKEVAQASGIQNVYFNFDEKTARAQGLIGEREVDPGVAYNLERIKTDDLRKKYLGEKGYGNNVLQDGDDFYTWENGKAYPINNKDGFDASDLIRLAAHAGRDIGSGLAATAAIGGGIVAAGPSGGTSIAGGIAAAGAAGAIGGTIGESAQRSLDNLAGTDAAKYNSQLSPKDSMLSAGKDAVIAGVGGALQPVGTAAFSAGRSILASAAEKLTGEWGAMAAAKSQASAALTRLPQGFMQKFASEEQMSAQAALTDTLDLAGKKAMTADQVNAATGEAANMLKSGAQKPIAGEAEEAAVQQGLRQKYTSQTVEAAKAAQSAAATEVAEKTADEATKSGLATKLINNAKKFFGEGADAKDMTIAFSDSSSTEAAYAAQQKVVAREASKFARGAGLKVDIDEASGAALGLEQKSFKEFIGSQRDTVLDTAEEALQKQRTGSIFMDTVPSDLVKGQTVTRLRQVVNNIDPTLYKGEMKAAANDLISAVEQHTQGANGEIRDAVEKFHTMAIDAAETKLSPKAKDAIDAVNGAMQRYEIASTTARDAVNGYYQGYNKLLSTKQAYGSNAIIDSPTKTLDMINSLNSTSQAVGDFTKELTRPLVNASYLNNILTGESMKIENTAVVDQARGLLTPSAREQFDALEFVKHFDTSAGKEVVSQASKASGLLGAAIGAGRAAMHGDITGMVTGAIEGYAGGRAAGILKNVAKPAGQAVLKGGSEALEYLGRNQSSTFKAAGFLGNIGAESLEEDQINKMRRRGNE